MRAGRVIGRLAAGLLALLLLAAAAGAWWVGQTASFVRWALAHASQATGGALSAGEVRGSLIGGVTVSRVEWRDARLQVAIEDLRLAWRPERLLAGELRLRELGAARVDVALAGGNGGGGPPALPERVALPLAVGIDALEVREIRVRGEGFEAPALRELRASLRLDQRGLQVPSLAGRVDGWAAVDAEARVAAAAPFAVELAARIDPAIAAYPKLPRLLLDLSGPLAALEARVRMLAPAGQPGIGEPGAPSAWATAQATIRPFEPLPLGALAMALDGFEPDAIGLPVPRARLSGGAMLEAVDGAGPAAPAWRGRIALRNALAGPIDAGALPFSNLVTGLHWDRGRLALDALKVDAGKLAGELRIDTTVTRRLFGLELPAAQARLSLRELDLSALHRQAWSTRLSGTLSLDADAIEFDLADARRGGVGLAGSASLQGEQLRIASLKLRTPSGSIEAAGSARWQAPWQVDLAGRFDALEPARLAAIAGLELPAQAAALSGLSGEWSATGEVAPALALESRLRLADGRLDGRPLRIDWRGRVEADRLSGIALSVSLGVLRAELSGDAGRAGDQLGFSVRLPSLAAVDPMLPSGLGIDGSLVAEGQLSVPALDASALERSRIAVRIDAQRLRHPAFTLERARARIEGSLGSHRAELALAGGRAGATRVAGSLSASGGLELPGAPAWRWRGAVDRLATEAPLGVGLAASMPLTVEPGRVEAGPGTLQADGGRLDLARVELRDGRFESVGEARALPVSRWAERLGLIPADAAAIDEVRVGAAWRLAGSSIDDLDGELELKVSTSERLDADGQARLALDRGRLSGKVDLVLPSLAVANRAIGPEWAVAGRLAVDAELSGTLREPRLAGKLSGRQLAMVQRRLGWRFSDGVLDARFDGDTLEVETLRLASGEGSVTLRGALSLQGMEGRFRLLAERLPVPIGPGQRIVLSGDTLIVSEAASLRWTGEIRADEGLIELRGGEAPSLPDDVEIVDASAPPAGKDAAGQAGSPLRLGADLEVDLGERIRVRGSGIDARLSGTLRLTGTLPDAPRATGTVRIRDGTYTAYGQKLEIARGRVIFNGPLDNPVLDIVAMRRGPAVEAGVAVTGTALSPRVRLVSEPDVPDAQKLSWLVLGVGPEDARTGGQVAALQAAAATLFGRGGDGLVSDIQRTLGLDVLTVRNAAASGFDANFGASFPGQAGTGSTPTTGATQDVIAMGKRFGSRMMVTYEQGLRGIWSLLRFQYDITRRLSVRAQTGTDTAIDLLYFYSFD
ncbi:translocation/assembly module TamB domain-containing protein [Burkholderiaceae bacterium FT117]|uniref:translocation/assembly module TamB domain-containing protein n=1 Tax=Zeimonas sediminis TaxID=2944268 RepID=UPI002342FCB6|nr:translocation/assembly module TamB domain-containing protein [Zeimonas sediminis]MCM5570550.1 translocation/assembly module TamB domain-containing protein [Zeimonas sediminis]